MLKRDYNNKIRRNEDVVTKFAPILKEIASDTETETLILRGNGLGSNQIKLLQGALSKHKHLKSLDLSYNQLGVDSIYFLKKIISDHPELNKIDLDFTGIKSPAHIYALMDNNPEELLQRFKTIDFSLAGNCIEDEGLRRALEMFSTNTIITILGNNQVDDPDFLEECRLRCLEELDNPRRNRPSR